MPLQLAREHDGILRCFSGVLHVQNASDLLYKNHPISGFHPTVHLYITECY